MADTVDEISGGRLILGLGAGWHEPEYAPFGYPFDHRVAASRRRSRSSTACCATGQIDFDGQVLPGARVRAAAARPAPAAARRS